MSKLCCGGWCLHAGNCFDLGIWGYTICADDVTKEAEGALAKLTFLTVQGDTGCLEALKCGKKSLLVFPLVFPIDDDVIH